MSFAWARLFYLFGPDEHASRLVPSVCDALLRQEPAKVTEGAQIRDFLHVDDAASALAIIAKSDLILTAPSALAQVAPAKLPVIALEPPLRLPRHSVNLLWHERFSNDPGHAWLRGVMLDVARAVPRAP